MRSSAFLRFLGVVLALVLAYGAQYLYDNPDMDVVMRDLVQVPGPATLGLASVLLLTGAVLFSLSAPEDGYPSLSESTSRAASFKGRNPGHTSTQAPGRTPTWRPVHRDPAALTSSRSQMILALAVYLITLGLYLLVGDTLLVRWLWLAGIVMLVLSQYHPTNLQGLIKRVGIQWRSYGLPLLILLVALILRLYRLPTLPQDLHGDMASHGLQALAILDGAAAGVIGVGWADIPLVGFLPTVVAMGLSGDRGTFGLGLASVVGGVLSVWGLYVLMVQLTNRRAALIAATLLAIAYTHIHFSRIAEYMDPLPMAVWALALLVAGFRTEQTLPFVLSGMMLGAAGLMYYSGRVAIAIVGLLLLYLLAVERPRLRANRQGLVLMALGFLVLLGPQLLYFAEHGRQLLSRSWEVFLFNPDVLVHLQAKYGVEGTPAVLWEQIKGSLLVFNAYPDSSTQFGFPRAIVDSVAGPLVVLGFAYAVLHVRRPSNGLLVLALTVILVLGGILTNNAPFWPRLLMILLPGMGLAAIAVDRAWDAVTEALGQETGRIVVTIVVGGLIYLGLANWLQYHAFATHNGWPRALVGRFVHTLPPDAPVCLVSEDPSDSSTWIHSTSEREVAFFLGTRPGIDLPPGFSFQAGQADVLCVKPGATWIVPESQQPVLEQLQSKFPGGVTQAHGPRQGETVFYSYQLPLRIGELSRKTASHLVPAHP